MEQTIATATAPPTLEYGNPSPNVVAAPPPDAPIAPSDRVVAIDALRGVAILGILLLNIRAFGMPAMGYMFPDVTPTSDADLAVFLGINAVGWGKFMSTFAMLYGVGILLSTRRFDASGGAAGMFFRRSGILAGVGLLHAFLIWWGDILFAYALIGMVAFFCRKLATKWLLLLAGAGFAISSFMNLVLSGLLTWGLSAGKFDAAEVTGTPEDWAAETAAYLGSFGDVFVQRAMESAGALPFMIILFGPQLLALMLVGMALFRSGFFEGGWRTRSYLLVGVLCWLVPAALTLMLNLHVNAMDWPVYWGLGWLQLSYGLLVPVQALGMASLLILLFTRSPKAIFTSTMAACGRMAFTNYLLQSILATTFFYGYGLGYFGKLGYTQQLGVVAAIWAFEIALSVLWLSRFRYGPLEWLWRGMTYGKFPALRKLA